MATLFVTEEYLKKNSLINDNVDMDVVVPVLIKIEDMFIQPIIGTGLFNELKTQIEASTAPDYNSAVTSLNRTLLELIRKCMVWYFMSEAPLAFTFRFMNKGVMKKSSDNSTPAELSEINNLMDKYKNDAEWYAERITNHLKENSADYPLYSNPGSGCDTIRPNTTNYTCGMNLEM
jgi:hypothetical protein